MLRMIQIQAPLSSSWDKKSTDPFYSALLPARETTKPPFLRGREIEQVRRGSVSYPVYLTYGTAHSMTRRTKEEEFRLRSKLS